MSARRKRTQRRNAYLKRVHWTTWRAARDLKGWRTVAAEKALEAYDAVLRELYLPSIKKWFLQDSLLYGDTRVRSSWRGS